MLWSSPLPSYGRDVQGLLTRRTKVVGMLARGFSMGEVARALGVPPRTVAYDKYSVMEANGLRTNCDLLAFASRHGLIEPFAPQSPSPEQVARKRGS